MHHTALENQKPMPEKAIAHAGEPMIGRINGRSWWDSPNPVREEISRIIAERNAARTLWGRRPTADHDTGPRVVVTR